MSKVDGEGALISGSGRGFGRAIVCTLTLNGRWFEPDTGSIPEWV